MRAERASVWAVRAERDGLGVRGAVRLVGAALGVRAEVCAVQSENVGLGARAVVVIDGGCKEGDRGGGGVASAVDWVVSILTLQ